MPTAAPPPPPPSAVAYPPPPPPTTGPPGAPASLPPPHKLSTNKIALIGGGSAAAIGGIVALVVLLGGGSDKNSPPTPKPKPVTTQSPSIGNSTSPGATPSDTTPSPTDTGSGTGGDNGGTTTSAGSIDLGSGVTLAVPSGWSASDTSASNKALLINQDAGVVFFVGVGQANSTDPTTVLSTDINSEVQGGSLSDVQLGDVSSGNVGGSVFDAIAVVPFTATQSTQQGTTDIQGRFGELINTQSGNSAFIVIKAINSSDIDAVDSDITAMVLSMAGATS
jgi:hypothetical protein